MAALVAAVAMAQAVAEAGMKQWVLGKGWGRVWGADDEVGALNERTDASRLAALCLVRDGSIFDLGVSCDRDSFN